jgi:hypothetical protein
MTPKLIGEDSLLDKIRAYYQGNVELSESYEVIRKRLHAGFIFMLDQGLVSDRKVAAYLQNTFGISETQAYRDIGNIKVVFGDVKRISKDVERYFASENAKEMFRSAMDFFNTTKKIAYYKLALEQQKLHMRINNLDNEDIDLPDPDKIQPPVQMLQINFEFIESRFFNYIDATAQEKLKDLKDQIMKIIESSPVKDYLETTTKKQIADDRKR